MNSKKSGMEMFKEMLKRLEQQNALKSNELDALSGSRCKHLRKDEDGGTPFCADCGLVFEDETTYLSGYNNMNHYHPTDYHDVEDLNEYDNTDYQDVEDLSEYDNTDHQDVEEHTPVTTKPEPTTKPSPTPSPNPTSVKDLIKIAKERGIKYSTTMSKKDLCTVLGLEIIKPIKFIFKNKETGEEHGFHSIYKVSKEMGINPGLVTYYLGKEITIGETIYTLSKVQ